jgi:hypothetical protein
MNKLLRYQRWLEGNKDRANGLPCKSANGDYLNGWYATGTIPDFLTQKEASELRKKLQAIEDSDKKLHEMLDKFI